MPSVSLRFVRYRQYVALAVVMVWALAFSAVAALAQTAVPPPTLSEMTTAVVGIVAGMAIVAVIVAAGFVLGAAIRMIVRLIRSGR